MTNRKPYWCLILFTGIFFCLAVYLVYYRLEFINKDPWENILLRNAYIIWMQAFGRWSQGFALAGLVGVLGFISVKDVSRPVRVIVPLVLLLLSALFMPLRGLCPVPTYEKISYFHQFIVITLGFMTAASIVALRKKS